MKLDDRDIICQQDYAPLSNAELLTQIEENLEWLRGAALFDTERVMGPARALLARAEAAEASREALADRLVFEMEQRETLAARAEAAEALAYERLENLLFAEQRANDLETLMLIGVDVPPPDDGRVGEAAQQWRPVTESEPYDDDVEIIVVASRSGVDGVWYYADETEDGINLWQEPRLWRPLPTPPATAEATE